jgi:hypothetical protein
MRDADSVLNGLDYRCFQAPYRQVFAPRPVPQSLSSTHTLEDFCFSEPGELYQRLRAWREIFDAVQPDLAYFEYSPGALIASRDRDFARVAVGNGFMLPPAGPVDGVFAPYATTPRDSDTLARLGEDDARLLSRLNVTCDRTGIPGFDKLGEIFWQADRTYITSLPELDNFGPRDPSLYIGMQPSFGRAIPTWPTVGRARVLCYLQNFPGISTLLQELVAADLAVLVYMRECPDELQQRFGRVPQLRFIGEAIKLEALSEEASFIIHHAGNGVAMQSFLGGLPQLSIPTQQEQLLTALQLDKAGVGVTAPHNQRSFARQIQSLVDDERYAVRARHYRDRYSGFRWADSEARILGDMSDLLKR